MIRLALLVAAFLLRFVVARSATLIEVDGAYWGSLARAVIHGDWTHGLHAAWPPLYPVLTAGLARSLPRFAGEEPAAIEWAARLVSVLAGTLLLLPLGAIGRRVLPPRWDLVLMALAAVHPRLVEYSAAALSESLFTLLLVAGVAGLMAAGGGSRRVLPASLAGATLGLAFLARPEGLLFGAVFTALATADRSRRRAAIPFFVAMVLVAVPWLLHLHRDTGGWTLGEKGAYNFWREHRAAYARHFPPPVVLAARVNRSPAIAPPPSPGEFHALALIAAEPGAVLLRTLRNLATLLVSTLPVAIGWPVALLAIAGLALSRASPWIVAPLIAIPLLFAPFTVDRRLLVPVVPFALVPAVAALEWLARRFGTKVGAAIAGLVLAGLLAYAATIPRRMDRAPELRAAGEWLQAHRPGSFAVLARKPQVAFYAGQWIADLPASRDSILADTRRLPGCVLVADARSARADRPGLAAWLDPEHSPPGGRVLHAWGGPDALVLYGFPPDSSAGSIR